MDTGSRIRRRASRPAGLQAVPASSTDDGADELVTAGAEDRAMNGGEGTASADRNRLLSAMPSADRARLGSLLVPVLLNRDDILLRPGERIATVIFIERGIVSIIGQADGRRVEIGMVGREGLAGVEAVLGVENSPYEHLVQLDGHGLQLEIGRLAEAMRESAHLRSLLLHYAHIARLQAAETAVSNGSQTIDRRLARWLLMYRDRTDGDDIAVTHKFLAIMLGVRRAGITEAIHRLEGERLIKARRSSLLVLDRPRLESFAGAAYGLAEAELDFLIPARAPHHPGS
jgi:CRP-like cAMP-binding protein